MTIVFEDRTPHPFQTVEVGVDPEWGMGRSVYSPGREFRYQTTRAFFGQEWDDEDREGTLAVLGVRPDPYGTATRLDEWAVPYAEAAKAGGFRQLLVVCLYGTMAGAIAHDAHGSLNGYFIGGEYLADSARTLAVHVPAGWSACQDCSVTGFAGPVTQLLTLQDADARHIEVVRLAEDWRDRDGDVWEPYQEARPAQPGVGLRRVV